LSKEDFYSAALFLVAAAIDNSKCLAKTIFPSTGLVASIHNSFVGEIKYQYLV